MKNISIAFKILIFMGLLTIISSATAIVLLMGMSDVNQKSSEIAKGWLPSVEMVSGINTTFSDFRIQEYKLISATSDEVSKKALQALKDLSQTMQEDFKKYELLLTTEKERELYQNFHSEYDEFIKIHEQVITFAITGNDEAAKNLLYTESLDKFNSAGKFLDDLITFTHSQSLEASEVADQIYATQHMIAIVAIIIMIGAAATFTIIVSRIVSSPISSITCYMDILSSGDLSQNVPSKDRKDEIGKMAQALQIFKDKLLKTKELENAAEIERMSKEARQERVNAATARFERTMSEIVKIVAAASTELQASANALASSANQTSLQADAVASASNESSANIQTVASSSEELSASISEISNQVQRSAQISAEAVEQGRLVSMGIEKLVDAAQKIGDVTDVIREISEQTNLLALNATIEAARAGEAGKGFAVVASEVKNLAASSAKSTEEIAQQIAHIQTNTQEAAMAVEEISTTIQKVSEISGAIAAAIEQQSAATKEITRNVSEASSAVNDVNSNITGVSEGTITTSSSAKELLGAATELGRQAEFLKAEFDNYVQEIRAA